MLLGILRAVADALECKREKKCAHCGTTFEGYERDWLCPPCEEKRQSIPDNEPARIADGGGSW